MNLAQNQKPLLGGRKFTEKLHESSNVKVVVLGGGWGELKRVGGSAGASRRFTRGEQLPRPSLR